MKKRIAIKITCSAYYNVTIHNSRGMLVVPKSPKHLYLLDKAFRKIGISDYIANLKKELKAFNSSNDFVRELKILLNES